MKELIDKAAVVAEIDKIVKGLQKNCNPNPMGNIQECLAAAQIEALNLIKDFLDTLEIKTVNLEKEIQTYKDEHNYMSEYVRNVAKHFFELGLKAQKGE